MNSYNGSEYFHSRFQDSRLNSYNDSWTVITVQVESWFWSASVGLYKRVILSL
jgi:hypothetical protein